MAERYILTDTGDIILNSVLEVYRDSVRPDRNYARCKRGQWVSVIATSDVKEDLEKLRDAMNLADK